MAQDWDIRSRGTKCDACEKDFEDGQVFHSNLIFGDEGYQRSDFCQSCWDAGKKDIGSVVSYWLGKFKAPPPPAEEVLKKETAESLLRKLMEEDDPGMHNVIFILAVMLERKRLLIERDVHIREDDHSMVRVYEHRKSGETFLVVDPKLSLAEIEPVQIQVINLLGGPRPPKSKQDADAAAKPDPDAEQSPAEAEPTPDAPPSGLAPESASSDV